MDGREIRLRRLLGRGRAVIIAIDHGLFDGPIPGMERLPETAGSIHPGVDGILLAPGMIRHCASVFAGQRRPLAIARLNWNTVYCFGWNYRKARSVESYTAEAALREGMDIALVSLTLKTGDEERDAANIMVFSKIVRQCRDLGIPVIGEYFPTGHTHMSPEQLHEDVLTGCRITAELGSDCIKTFFTNHFEQVTSSCPVPVFGLGAEKLPEQVDALRLAQAEVKAGAGGVVFGRNAIQVPNPQAFQQALCEVVRNGADPAEMAREYRLDTPQTVLAG